MTNKYEIYDAGGLDGRRLLKNGRAINEFGMLKEVEKLTDENSLLRSALMAVTNELESWNLTEGDPVAVKAIAVGKAALAT